MLITSPAKINLSLRVLRKRDDGFHEIATRMCKLTLADSITLEPFSSGKTTQLTCSDPAVPADETNLALRALRLFEERTGLRRVWRIHLEKRIPSGAGLGGGSSNAAAILRALNDHEGRPLGEDVLYQLGSQLGSDVPFFLNDSPACDCTGRGEQIAPAFFPWQLPVVLIKPPFPIPTPWAYQRWAASRELNGVLYAPQLCAWGAMVNDLERPVFEKHLILATLKSKLLERGETAAALMSGSGSTVFAITTTAAAAEETAAHAREWCGANAFVQVTETLASAC